MRKNKAIFGAEVSGHYAFKDFNYLDSGLFMLVQFINMMASNPGKRLSTLVKPLNKYVDIGEVNYNLAIDSDKQKIIKSVLDHFKVNRKKLGVKKILTLDGVSVYLKNSWLNIRQSNTEPMIRLRVEGRSVKEVAKIKKLVEKFIL
jgi:phosphomannomutase